MFVCGIVVEDDVDGNRVLLGDGCKLMVRDYLPGAVKGPRFSEEAPLRLQQVLESGDVEFIAENGGGLGVRLRKRNWSKQPKYPLHPSSGVRGLLKIGFAGRGIG